MRIWTLAFVGVALTGCGSPPAIEESPDYEVVAAKGTDDEKDKNKASPSDETTPPETPETPAKPATAPAPPAPADADRAPAAPAAPSKQTTLKGKSAATASVPFGDPTGNACRYTVTMKNIAVSLTMDENTVTSAKVTSTMNEVVTDNRCGVGAIKPNPFDYSLAKNVSIAGFAVGSKVTLPMKADHVMSPNARLDVVLEKVTSGVDVRLTWTRDEKQAASYLWTVGVNRLYLEP